MVDSNNKKTDEEKSQDDNIFKESFIPKDLQDLNTKMLEQALNNLDQDKSAKF